MENQENKPYQLNLNKINNNTIQPSDAELDIITSQVHVSILNINHGTKFTPKVDFLIKNADQILYNGSPISKMSARFMKKYAADIQRKLEKNSNII